MPIGRRTLLAQGIATLATGNPVKDAPHWSLSDGARQQGSQLTLESAKAPGAAASWTRSHFPQHFHISFRARFHSLGLADESTGDRATFQLQLGGEADGKPFSAVVTFLSDRYTPEPNTKVFRTDSNWHLWRLDFDAVRHTVALTRDGVYIALHTFDAVAEPGIRLVARGSAELAAKVDISDFSLAPAKPTTPTPHTTPTPQQRPHALRPISGPTDWPLWRRDTRHSALCPLQADLRDCRITQRIPVPETAAVTPLWLDLDGDGQPEALLAHGGNLTARRRDNTLLWRQRLDGVTVYGLFDLDGDGHRELLVAAGTPSQLHILDPRTGAVRYRSPHRPRAGVAGVRVGALNPDKKGLQVVVWAHFDEIGYCLSFENGIESAALAWTFDWKMSFFTPLVALADMDRDGASELVVVTYNHAFVYDGRTGAVKIHTEWSSGRNYGTLVLTDIDGDGFPDVVVLADVLREHIAVLRNEGGKALIPLWDQFTEQNYPDDHAELRVLTESVADFDGDGAVELAWSIYDDRTDRHWKTRITDARTGKTKRELPNTYLVAAGSLLPGKPPVLVLSHPTSRTSLGLAKLSVWSGEGTKQCDLPAGTLLARNTVADFAPNAWGQVSGIATGTPTTALQSHRGRPIVPLRSSDGRTVALTALDAQGAPQVLETLSVPAGQAIDTVNITDGIAYSAGFDGRYRGFVQGIETHALDCRGGTIVQPIVARLRATEAPAVLFIDPSGTLRCIDGADGHERWSRTATGCYSYYMPNSRPHGIPVAVDIDGDGTLEVLVAERPNRLVALAPDGAVKRTWTLPGAPQMWTVGDFNGDGVWDLLVTYARGAVLDVATVVISGRSGKLLWSMQGGNGPSAVADVDGDGRDDILTRDLYERRIWRGSDGRDLQPIEIQAGYHTPVIPSSPYDGVLWLGGSWSALAEDRDGKRLWRHWLAPTGSGCAADVDGDGRLEVATVTAGNIYALPDLRPINGPNQEFLCHDARTGALRWSLPLNATTPGIVAGDVDGDGHPEFVFGTSDARLIALGGDGKIRWERNLPAALGVPVLADVAGDGKLEVLIPCADGHLYRFSADTPAPRRLSS